MKNLLTAFFITIVLPGLIYGVWEYSLQKAAEEKVTDLPEVPAARETVPIQSCGRPPSR